MKKIVSDIASLKRSLPSPGKKIVFTNGCFDLLHKGHLQLLEEAKKLGDILIVAVNDDASVIKLKGETRPVQDINERMQQLAELSSTDLIIPFSEDTPGKLIEAIRPDVLVKGGDYKESDIAGAAFVRSYGGQIILIPLLEGYSTTSIISSKS
jgi:D-beta-D-heptose 7-phosphate kinase/D-beta-D-heptose 1-phosphate adenosyltransferase